MNPCSRQIVNKIQEDLNKEFQVQVISNDSYTLCKSESEIDEDYFNSILKFTFVKKLMKMMPLMRMS